MNVALAVRVPLIAPSIQLRHGEMVRVRRKLAFLPDDFEPFEPPEMNDDF